MSARYTPAPTWRPSHGFGTTIRPTPYGRQGAESWSPSGSMSGQTSPTSQLPIPRRWPPPRSSLADLDGTPELRAAGTEARVANSKGTLTDLVIVLSGPSTVAGAVRIFHLWLSRDKRRSITLTRKLEGQPAMEIRIEGEAISEQAVRRAIEQISQAAESVGGG
jgi:hypothetical protein